MKLPKSDTEKRYEGTYRKDRARKVRKLGGKLECPKDLGLYGKCLWNSIIESLEPSGLCSLDGEVLRNYCKAAEDIRRWERTIEAEGETFRSDTGYVGLHPLVKQISVKQGFMLRASSKLGLNLVDRKNIPEAPEEQEDELAKARKRAAERKGA